jgi:hypothetical protein
LIRTGCPTPAVCGIASTNGQVTIWRVDCAFAFGIAIIDVTKDSVSSIVSIEIRFLFFIKFIFLFSIGIQ